MKRIIILLLVLISLNLFGQEKAPLVIFKGKDYPTRFLNENGEVLFTLPQGDYPLGKNYLGGIFGYLSKVFGEPGLSLYQNGICVIKNKNEEVHWLDQNGETIKSFGNQYHYMGTSGNSFYLAKETNESSYLTFLNYDGESAFENNKFWNATHFSEGLAGVQFEDKNGQYAYINQYGETVIFINELFGDHNFNLFPFTDGLARVKQMVKSGTYSTNDYYYFIDKNGKIILDLYKLFPGKSISANIPFKDGVTAISIATPNTSSRDLVFINSSGETLLEFKNANLASAFNKGVAFISKKYEENGLLKNKKLLIDKSGKILDLGIDTEKEEIMRTSTSNNFYFYIQSYQFEDHQYVSRLYSYETKKPVFETISKIISYNENLVLLDINGLKNFELVNILTEETIWANPPEEVWFTSIEKALAYKDKVKNFIFDFNSGDFSKLFYFKNLTHLEIKVFQNESWLKEIAKMEKLEYFSINYVNNIKSLPPEIANLKNLKKLTILDCTKLRNIEPVILKLESLEELELSNYVLENGFKEKIKLINPKLKIITSFFYNDEGEELFYKPDPID